MAVYESFVNGKVRTHRLKLVRSSIPCEDDKVRTHWLEVMRSLGCLSCPPDLGMVVSNRPHCNLFHAGSWCGLFHYLLVDQWLTLVCWSRLQDYFFSCSKWFQWALYPLVIMGFWSDFLWLTMPGSVHAQHERAMCKILNFTYSEVQTMFKQENYKIWLFDVKQSYCYHSFNIVKYNQKHIT